MAVDLTATEAAKLARLCRRGLSEADASPSNEGGSTLQEIGRRLVLESERVRVEAVETPIAGGGSELSVRLTQPVGSLDHNDRAASAPRVSSLAALVKDLNDARKHVEGWRRPGSASAGEDDDVQG